MMRMGARRTPRVIRFRRYKEVATGDEIVLAYLLLTLGLQLY